MIATGSSAALLLHCGFSFRADIELPPRESSQASDYGTKLHKLCEEYATGVNRKPVVPADMQADWEVCRSWIDTNYQDTWECEQPIAFEWVGGDCRYLERRGQARDYEGKTEFELPGTIDILDQGVDVVTVYDWTTARNYGYKWPQLKLYLMMACRVLGKRGGRMVMLQVKDGILTEDVREVSGEELDMMGAAIQFAAATVKESKPAPGGHCTELYCKLRHTCPAVVEMRQQAVQMATKGLPVVNHRLSLEILNDEHAAWSLAAVDAVDSALTEIRARLKAYADAVGGIPLGNGMVYAASTTKREVADVDQTFAIRVLERHGADSAVVTRHTMSWTDLDKAVGKAKAKTIRAELAAMGAVKVNEFQTYSAKKART